MTPGGNRAGAIRSALVPPGGRRSWFWIACVVVLVVLLAVLALQPRGGASDQVTVGREVSTELSEGVTLTLLPEMRNDGWRADNTSMPYRLTLWTTVENDSALTFPRSVRVKVLSAADDDPRRLTTNGLPERRPVGLNTMNVPPGESAGYDFSFDYSKPHGNFTALIDYLPPSDDDDPTERQTVEVPFGV